MYLAVHDYSIYNGDDELIGDGEEVTLADLTPEAVEISGCGLLGPIKVPIPGYYGPLEVNIPFRMLSDKASALFISTSYSTVKIYGGLLYFDPQVGSTVDKSIVVTVKGMGSKLSPGKLKQANKMDSGVSIEAVYYYIEVDEKPIFELDKVNKICKVNGVDILENLRKMCEGKK